MPLNPDFSPTQTWPLNPPIRNSLLNFYKRLLVLRRASAALTCGDLKLVINLPRDVLGYLRIAENEQMLVLLNFGDAKSGYSPTGFLAGMAGVFWAAIREFVAENLSVNITLAGSEALILTQAGGQP